MPKHQAITSLVAALALVGLLASCGASDPTPTSTAAPPTSTPTPLPPGATPVPTPTTDAFAAEWDALISAAQAEEEVFRALGGAAPRYGAAVFREFTRQFCVRVVACRRRGSDHASRRWGTADKHGLTTDLRVVVLLHRRVEGVHISVQDVSQSRSQVRDSLLTGTIHHLARMCQCLPAKSGSLSPRGKREPAALKGTTGSKVTMFV